MATRLIQFYIWTEFHSMSLRNNDVRTVIVNAHDTIALNQSVSGKNKEKDFFQTQASWSW